MNCFCVKMIYGCSLFTTDMFGNMGKISALPIESTAPNHRESDNKIFCKLKKTRKSQLSNHRMQHLRLNKFEKEMKNQQGLSAEGKIVE
jgi:hypothetical protein